MTENATGVADGSAAGGQVDDKGAVDDKGTVDDKAAAAAAAAAEMRTVPLESLTKIREELNAVKDQNRLYQAQLSMGQGRPAAAPAAAAPATTPDPFEGMEAGDVMTVEDVRKVLKSIPAGEGSGESAKVWGAISKLQLSLQDPNYENTIRTFLPEIITNNPAIAAIIQSSPDPLQAALVFAKTNPRYKPAAGGGSGDQKGNETILDQIDQIIANANKPGSASQAAGSGAINTASRFANMTEQEIDEHANKVIAGNT